MAKEKDDDILKLQCKVKRKLATHVKRQKGFVSMNSYIKNALIEKSGYVEK